MSSKKKLRILRSFQYSLVQWNWYSDITDACNSGASGDHREPISLHQAVLHISSPTRPDRSNPAWRRCSLVLAWLRVLDCPFHTISDPVLQPIVITTGHITFLQPTAMATGILHDIPRSKCVHDVTEDVGTKQLLRQQSTGTCFAVEGLNRAWRQHRWRSRSSSSWCHP